MAAESIANLVFTGPLRWTEHAECRGESRLFFAPAANGPRSRATREAQARAVCRRVPRARRLPRMGRVSTAKYGFWGGESEEDRAAAGFRVDMPVGRVARYPRGDGRARPAPPRSQRVNSRLSVVSG